MSEIDYRERLRSGFDSLLCGNDPLQSVESWIWSELRVGSVCREHPWNLGCLSSVEKTKEGMHYPRSRTVVLRASDVVEKTLDFHTDKRSAKMCSLLDPDNETAVCWLFYSHETKIQLRMDASYRILDSIENRAYFEATPDPSKRVYASVDPPGQSLSAASMGLFDIRVESALANFCVVRTKVHYVDLVMLSPNGNKRLGVDYQTPSEGPKVSWLVP
jgi:hypothetical protein